jgi:phosphoribosylformimino-5-aminoimidazole carboxamide ribonucleotide (ProFAR) isomerase
MPTPKAETDDWERLDPKQLLTVLTSVKKGNFSVRMPVEKSGIAGKVADTLNDIIELNEKMTKELERINIVVGKALWEGRVTLEDALARG